MSHTNQSVVDTGWKRWGSYKREEAAWEIPGSLLCLMYLVHASLNQTHVGQHVVTEDTV